MVRVLVIAESQDRAEIVRAGLALAGCELAEIVQMEAGMRPALERSAADAVIVEASSPTVDLLDRVVDAMGSNSLPMIVFSGDGTPENIERGIRAGATAYVVDGLKAERVPAIVSVALARFGMISELRSELATAQQKLAERKFVERAKGLLMKARNLSEDEAYHTLRRMAMERNRRMGEVAKSVIEMAELLN
jgi:response regulator NasT